jgi:hypothetical protein
MNYQNVSYASKGLASETSRRQRASRSLQRAAVFEPSTTAMAPSTINDVLRSPGQPLDAATRAYMEPRFGHDFSHVRVHTDDKASASARSVNALAYTAGSQIAFGTGRYQPDTSAGRELIAHELAHVVQQGNTSTASTAVAPPHGALEDHAQQVASEITRFPARVSPSLAAPGSIQRRVEFRDVGRGEQSGFARLPDLIARLNAMPGGLTYSLNGNELAYARKEGEELSAFDEQMMEFVDLDAVLPLRLTNRHGLLGSHATGFNVQVQADAWASGYVDIDDLLGSTDLGLQFALVHFIRERAATPNYARRIGSASMTQPAFNAAHAQGIQAEVRLLQGFFGDPSIRFVTDSASNIFRVFRNDRGDRFRARLRSRQNIDAVSVEVRTADGRIMTPEEYLDLLRQERIRAQVERERLGGAAEHMAGGRAIPAP